VPYADAFELTNETPWCTRGAHLVHGSPRSALEASVRDQAVSEWKPRFFQGIRIRLVPKAGNVELE